MVKKAICKIYVNETKHIATQSENYSFYGIPNDSCWLFRSNNDNDSIYRYSMIPDNSSMYFTFFSLRDVPNSTKPINKENLLSIIKDDKDLLILINKDKLIKAIMLFNEKSVPK